MVKAISVSLGTLAFVLAACGGNSPQDECNKIAHVTCTKLYACVDPATIQQATGYTSEGDCESTTVKTLDCATAKDTCPQGTTFDGNAADTCVNDYNAESCNQVQQGTSPLSCASNVICH